MAVRTTRLVGPVTVTNTTAIIYTVPAGMTALIKEWVICDQGSTATVVRFFLNGTGVAQRIVTIPTNAAGTVTFSPSFIVLVAGDVLRAQLAAAGNMTVTLHGALLDGVA